MFRFKSVKILGIMILFVCLPAFADIEDFLSEYSPESFKSGIDRENDTKYLEEHQKKIDEELEQKLGVKLIRVDLIDCLKAAAEFNFDIREKKYSRKEARMNNYNAWSKLLPDASYNYTIARLHGTLLVGGVIPVDVSEVPKQSFFNFVWDMERLMPFFDIVRTKKLYNRANALLSFGRDEALYHTAMAYFELLLKKAEMEIYTSNLVNRTVQYKETKAKYLAGVGTKLDVSRSEAELAQAKQQYIQSIYDIRYAQALLALYVGVKVETPLYPKERIPAKGFDLDCSLDELIASSKNNRKDIIATREYIKALKIERNSVYTEFVPDVNVDYTKGWYGTVKVGMYPSDTLTLSVNARLGKKLGVDTVTRAKALTQKIKAEETKLIESLREIEAQTIKSYYASESANEKIEASKSEVAAANDGLKNAAVQFKVGVATFLDIIQAQNQKVTAEINMAKNITDYNKARIQMMFDSGIISIQNISDGYKTP